MPVKQSTIDPGRTLTAVEQSVAAGNQFTGALPADAVDAFVPFFYETDGVLRMSKPDNATLVGTVGGLFTFQHKQPIVLKQILADLADAASYEISLVTTDAREIVLLQGVAPFAAWADDRMAWRIMPGESIKVVTAGATAEMWIRLYTRSEQGFTA